MTAPLPDSFEAAPGPHGPELFIYYRVRSDRLEQARQAVCSMHATLSLVAPTLVARSLRRCDTDAVGNSNSSGPHCETWMEIYSFPGGVPEHLALRIENLARAWANCLDGHRHVEVFAPCVW